MFFHHSELLQVHQKIFNSKSRRFVKVIKSIMFQINYVNYACGYRMPLLNGQHYFVYKTVLPILSVFQHDFTYAVLHTSLGKKVSVILTTVFCCVRSI